MDRHYIQQAENMLKQNSAHLKKVAIYGGILTASAAVAGYFLLPPKFAYSVLIGAGLSLANIYSIIMMVEAIAGAAVDTGPSGGMKAVATVMHLLKLGAILAVLAVLIITRAADLPGLIAGFTVVLMVHGVVGFMKARENLVIEEAEAAEEASKRAADA